MTEHSSNRTDPNTRRGLVSWILLPLSLFPLVALLTYDWHAIAALNTPPAQTSNWIGALGDGFAYCGYTLFGLSVWIVPILCVLAAVGLLCGRRPRLTLRTTWLLPLVVSAAGLLQVFGEHAPGFARLAADINVPHCGGAVGYLLMTRLLTPLVSDFGATVLMALVLAVSIVSAIGLRTIAQALSALLQWALHPEGSRLPAQPQGEYADEASPESDLQAQYQAALAAKAAAKEAARQEKERAKAEKAAAKEAARQEKERIRAEKEAARQAERESRGHLRLWGDAETTPRPEPQPAPQPELPAFQPAPPPPSAAPVAPKSATLAASKPAEDKGPYILPSLALLKPLQKSEADHSDVGEMSQKLIDTLKLFGVDATLAYTVQGPVVTKYALQLAPGIRYSAVTNIQDNLMGALHAKSLRIEAPIPGEECIGVEVPNAKPAGISFREIFESEAWRTSKAELPLLFGKRADGKELIADLASMPHMLVAGATGQGKSVCLNSLICGLLMTRTPEQLKLIMVDPKMVEFTPYAAIPHLIVPVITENKKVVFSLHWAVAEMEKRLKLFARARVRNIYDFNHRPNITQTDMFGNDAEVGSDIPKTVPYIVIIIDEAADLIGQCGKEVNPDIQRITQKARAAGIHLVLATQRPDAKIITGTIKANIPGRVAFKTASSVDSRTILDETGAENLIGKGDMLFRGKDNNLVRAQGAWISDDDIQSVTAFIERHSNVQFDDRFAKKLGTIKEEEVDLFADPEADAESAKAEAAEQREQVKAEENASDFKKAVECIINTNRASTSHFQRKLGWGYNHSAKIMDMLEDAGIIGPQSGAGPRQIIMDQDQLLAVFNGNGNQNGAAPADGTPPNNMESTEPEPTTEEIA